MTVNLQSESESESEKCEGKHVVRAGDDRRWFGNYRMSKAGLLFRLIVRDHTALHFLPLPTTLTMSDSDGDFSDELLELAGATEKKRKRRERSSKSEAKRRKAE